MRYRFNGIEVDCASMEVRSAGKIKPTEPQVFDLLRVLIENRDRVVSRGELISLVWNGRIVSETTISARINAARRAVGDSGRRQAVIKTIPRRGYRFIAPVVSDADAENDNSEPNLVRTDLISKPNFDQEIRYCNTSDKVRLAYATSGAGKPIVQVMSWLTHVGLDWNSPLRRPYFEELSRRHQLVRYDGRGNGLSDWEVEDLSFEAMVSDFETVVDAANLKRFSIFTKSQGCAIAIAYAVRHPERVQRMVLLGGYAQGWRKRSKPDEIKRREALASLIEVGWGTEHPAYYQMFASLYFPDGLSDYIGNYIELQKLSASPANAVRLYQTFSNIDVVPLLDKVRIPTLVMHSRGDAVAPFESGWQIAAAIPGARFVPLESRNHNIVPNEPAWEQVLQELRTFLPT